MTVGEQGNPAEPERDDIERLLNLIATDPAIRQELLANPMAALERLGFGDPSAAPTERQCDYTCIVSGTCKKTCQVTCDVTG